MQFYVKNPKGKFLAFSVGAIDAEAYWADRESDAWRGERSRAEANAREFKGVAVAARAPTASRESTEGASRESDALAGACDSPDCRNPDCL